MDRLVKAIGHPFGRVPNDIGHVCGRVFGHVGLTSWAVSWASTSWPGNSLGPPTDYSLRDERELSWSPAWPALTRIIPETIIVIRTVILFRGNLFLGRGKI